MMVNVCMRMLFSASCAMSLVTPSLGYTSDVAAFNQALIQQDTIPTDTAQRVAKGQVKDSEGKPLAGVTVSIQNSDTKTLTDEHGTYEITSQTDTTAMLVFSMLGFEPFEMPMSIANGEVVTLQPQDADANVLEEVVVIGYGTVRKKNLTGSVSSLRGDAFQNNAITNTEDGIAGKIAGVRVSQGSGAPGKPANIKIRGLNSVTASSNPLYVIDGFLRTTCGM